MKWLLTGGAGFIGSNFVRMLLRDRPDAEIVNVDALTYAGNLENLADIQDHPRYTFVRGDIMEPAVWADAAGGAVDIVVNMAAESHVDRSIDDPFPFLRTNVLGAQAMLDWARRSGVKTFVQVSTDEVYGSLGPGDPEFTERSPLAPNSPYSASKASADLLVRAARETHGMRTVVTRCSNNYGPYQFPEKLIPLMIANMLEDRPLPVYGDGLQVRDWIHVEDHCRGVLMAAENGRAGETYNFGASGEQTNIAMVHRLLELLGKPRSLIRHVEDRKGHDRRYAVDSGKAREELGWKPAVAFDAGLASTVEWYTANRTWWTRVRSGDYQSYYERHYGARLSDSEPRGAR